MTCGNLLTPSWTAAEGSVPQPPLERKCRVAASCGRPRRESCSPCLRSRKRGLEVLQCAMAHAGCNGLNKLQMGVGHALLQSKPSARRPSDHSHAVVQDRREARLKDEIEKYRAENPKITEQFADLKRKLGQVSESEWEAIPEIGDRTIKNKQRRFESFVPVPDTLLAAAAAEKQTSAAQPGDETSGYATTDLTAVGEGRETVSIHPASHGLCW